MKTGYLIIRADVCEVSIYFVPCSNENNEIFSRMIDLDDPDEIYEEYEKLTGNTPYFFTQSQCRIREWPFNDYTIIDTYCLPA